MKRILSTMLVAAMLLSLVIVAAAVPAAAVDGAWTTWGHAAQHEEGFDGDANSVVGYEYTAEGLHTVPADYSTSTPFALIQTKAKVNLKDGVYMLVRVDNFTYAGDKWFNVNIWDRASFEPGATTFGEGVQNLIRPGNAGAEGQPGTISSVSWYTGPFGGAGSSSMAADAVKADDQGRPLMALTVTWDGSTYAVNINGAAAPQAVIDWMNNKWGGNDSEAYIGFCFQNNQKGGTVEATILKFGTSEADATVPMGDDSKAPENYSSVPAEIADASTVPAGQPAIFMNGNKVDSDVKGTPVSAVGATISINEDYSIHVVTPKTAADSGMWKVRNEVSYDIDDFPVGVCLTRNFCTCGDDECYALESTNVYLCTGDVMQPDPAYAIKELDMSYDPYVIGDDTYLMFYFDMSDEYAPFDAEGRINGTRFDFSGVDIQTPGRNAFDVMFVAFFRNVDEASAYVESYLGELGWGAEDETTAAPVVETTEAKTEEKTEAKTEAKTEEKTEAKTEAKTDAKTDAPATGDDKKSGCGGVVGFGAIAVVAVAAVAGMVAFKKED